MYGLWLCVKKTDLIIGNTLQPSIFTKQPHVKPDLAQNFAKVVKPNAADDHGSLLRKLVLAKTAWVDCVAKLNTWTVKQASNMTWRLIHSSGSGGRDQRMRTV